jgi:cysteine desulfuration protein SufE
MGGGHEFTGATMHKRRGASVDGVTDLPPSLAEIRDDFLSFSAGDRLQLLMEFSNELPAMPEHYRTQTELLERVEECQSPVYVVVDVAPSGRVDVHATAPAEAPTTRGFASIIAQGLSGLDATEVLAVPDDFALMLGLNATVSPLRLNGMSGMLWRVKRQVITKMAI